MSLVRDSRYHPASIKQAIEMQAGRPNAANVRRSCRVKETSSAKSIWHDESNKIGTVLSTSHQFKIRLGEINKHISDGINKDCEHQRSEELQQIRG